MNRVLQVIITLTFCLAFGRGVAQDYKLKSMDGEFTMEVARQTSSVKITFYFTDASKYKYLVIEREIDGQFRQCAYVDVKESYGGALEALDKYPASNLKDSYYRVRTVTTDEIERLYPPVRLPAATQQSESGNK